MSCSLPKQRTENERHETAGIGHMLVDNSRKLNYTRITKCRVLAAFQINVGQVNIENCNEVTGVLFSCYQV